MQINFSYTSNRSGDIRASAYETTALSSPVAVKDITGPFLPSKSTFLTVPNPVVHMVRINALSGGVAGALLHEFEYDPAYDNAEITGPYQVVVGGDITLAGVFVAAGPSAGDKDINITALAGKIVDWVSRRGSDFLRLNEEYINKSAGGITLVGNSVDDTGTTVYDTFSAGETIFIQPPVNITTVTPMPSNFVQLFADTEVITDSLVLGSTQLRKLLILQATGTGLTVGLPALSSVPNNAFYGFCTPAGNQKQSAIPTDGADLIQYWNGSSNTSNQVCMGVNEFAVVFKTTISSVNKWLVLFQHGNFDCVGERIYADKILPNTMLEDGGISGDSTTHDFSGDDYPRVWAHLLSLPSNQKTDYTTWNLSQIIRGDEVFYNRGLWGINVVEKRFRPPDTRNNGRRAMKGTTDANRIPDVIGGYMHHMIIEHQHEETIGTLPAPLFGHGASRVKGNYNGSPATGLTDLTSKPVNAAGVSLLGTETTMQNNGYLSLIKI